MVPRQAVNRGCSLGSFLVNANPVAPALARAALNLATVWASGTGLEQR